MEIDEYRLEFLQELRNDAIVDGNDVEDQFVKAKIQELEEIGELIDPIAFSCEMRGSGNRAIAFDAYGYDEADSSFVLLISDFQNTIEKTTLTNTRIDELYSRMRNFIVEAYNGDIRRFCDAANPIIDIAKELKTRIGTGSLNTEILKFKFFIITNSVLSVQVKSTTKEDILERPVEINLWTLERFYQAKMSNVYESIRINCRDFNCEEGIQCLKANLGDNNAYDSYMAIVPGKFLADIYLKHGSRLLEGNVRAFLSVRGKVNRKIRETIIGKHPENFFTYNNGIAVVAHSIELSSDGARILSFNDFQIINGGQTTASLASAIVKKEAGADNFAKIFVPMKLTVLNVDGDLSEEEEAKYNEITQQISKSANCQNPVSDADFFSNDPFHRIMEELSLKHMAPPVNGSPHQTIWYYERSKGRWEQDHMNPHTVCAGSANNMRVFAGIITELYEKSKDSINEFFFKKSIAAVILFDDIDRIVNKSEWYPKGGNKAQIVPYTIAKLIASIPKGKDIDWKRIWNKQMLYAELVHQVEIVAKQVHEFLLDSGGAIVREYAKKASTWKKFRDDYTLCLTDEFLASLVSTDLLKDEEKAAKRARKFNSDIDLEVEFYTRGYDYWMKFHNDMEREGVVSGGDIDFIKSLASYIVRGSLPSKPQIKKLLKIITKAEDAGYIMPQ